MKRGDMVIGRSSDPDIAARGESGGVVTALLKLALEEGLVDGVLAVREGEDRTEGIPTFISDPAEVAGCAGSLHFASPSIAKSVKTYLDTNRRRLAVVCKACDARALVELGKINQVNPDNVLMIGLNCSGTLAPVPHAEMLRRDGLDPQRLEWEDVDEEEVRFRFDDGTQRRFALEELELDGLGRRGNCRRCEYPIPRMTDLACGKWGTEQDGGNATFVEVCSARGAELLERAAAAGAVELSAPNESQIRDRAHRERQRIAAARGKQAEDFILPDNGSFWPTQFEGCIKCYGCRDACPLCHCKRCVLERDNPQTVTRGVVPPPLSFGMIRLLHVASQCVNCGQCEDACSTDIPLSRLAHGLNRAAGQLFHYEAGTDPDAPLPLCAIPEEEKRLESTELRTAGA